MIKTYKLLSILLSYPENEIREFLPEALSHVAAEQILGDRELHGIRQFIEYFSAKDLTEWQEHYVQLFDYSRAVSLYLFEHVHGDSKDRGQAIVDLMSLYNENGLQINREELPDYLPAFLEFLSMQERDTAMEMLAETVDILKHILDKLNEKDNPYQYILAAVLSMSPREPGRKIAENSANEMINKDIDKENEEPRVSFGGDPCMNFKY
jgi:nitrate reductase delta subunit